MSGRLVLRRPLLLAAGAVVALTAAQLLRQPGEPTWNTIWAEDGSVYATDALESDWASSVFRGYANYVQVVPRLLALPLRVLPAEWWAGWLAGVAAVVTSLLALFVFRMAGPFLPSLPLRITVAAMVGVLPALWFESNANLANLPWPFVFAAFWALITTRRTRGDVAARIAVLVGAALSTPIAVLYAPLALVLLWRRRAETRERWAIGAFLGACALQMIMDLFAAGRPSHARSIGELGRLFVVRVVGSGIVGERGTHRLWDEYEDAYVAGLAVIALMLAAWAVSRLPRDQLRLPAVAAGYAVAFYAAPVWVSGTADLLLPGNPGGTRYSIVPVLLLVTAVALVLQQLGDTRLHWLLVAQSVVVVVAAFGMTNIRSLGPGWSDELDEARASCVTAEGGPVAIDVTPPLEEWQLSTRCDRLG